MNLRTTLLVLLAFIATIASAATPLELPLLPGERWWGGWSVDGPLMPFDARTQLSRTLYGNDGTNQRAAVALQPRPVCLERKTVDGTGASPGAWRDAGTDPLFHAHSQA